MQVAVEKTPIYSDEYGLFMTDEALYGEHLRLLSGAGNSPWVMVQTDGGLCGFVDPTHLAQESVHRMDACVCATSAPVLAEPDIGAPCIFSLPRFARVLTAQKKRGFQTVHLLDGRVGYVHENHLQMFAQSRENLAESVVDTALSLLGVPYRWGGRSAVGVDCSGLISLAFGASGVVLARDTSMMHSLPQVEKASAKRGDLVLFSSHVGLMLNRTKFIHASAAVGYVCLASLDPASYLFDAAHVAGGYTIHRVI